MDLLALHRYGGVGKTVEERTADLEKQHNCLWELVLERRRENFEKFEPKKAFVPQKIHFCRCYEAGRSGVGAEAGAALHDAVHDAAEREVVGREEL